MSFRNVCILFVGIFSLAILSCSNDPISSELASGTVKISIKRIGSGVQGKVADNTAAFITISSAQVVIEKIEFESSLGDTMDFEFEHPFVQDLMVGSNLHEIDTVRVPFGSYSESEIEIDELDEEDEAAYTQNPQLQNKSILVTGYLNDNPNETFIFTSDLSAEQEREFEPPLVLAEGSPSTNIVLTINLDTWFRDNDGNPLDPRIPNNKSIIEENIKNSFDVFEDDDDDGEDDDDDGEDD